MTKHPSGEIFEILQCEKKTDLDRLIKGFTLEAKELIRFTNAASLGILHPIRCRNLVRILPTDSDVQADLSQVRSLKPGKIAKLAGKINRTDRMHCILIYVEGEQRWWAFSFRLSDLGATGTMHYDVPHLHLTCFLSQPTRTFRFVLDAMLNDDRPNLPHDYHVAVRGDLGQNVRFM